MTHTETPLDRAFAISAANPDDDALRARFFGALVDAPLWILLAEDAVGDEMTPKLIETAEGPVVLAFDSEDRLSDFAQETVPHAGLPGRALISLLAGSGVGMGLNIGVAASETMLGTELIDWLNASLQEAPDTDAADTPIEFHPPSDISQELLGEIDGRLARAAGLAAYALLVRADYRSGRSGLLLAVIGATPAAEPALAGAIADIARFGGAELALDIAFLGLQDPTLEALSRVGLRFDIPLPETAAQDARPAPGSDPDRPPILR